MAAQSGRNYLPGLEREVRLDRVLGEAGRLTLGARNGRVLLGRPHVARLQPTRETKASWISPLERYLKGWAKADLEEILDGTAADYCFRDPFVGTFSRRSLHEYFDVLMNRCSRVGPVKRRDIAFEVHGPMEAPSYVPGLWFYREAPRIGLTGVTQIEVGEQGVFGESVAYDANMASDMLRPAVQ